MGALRVAIEKKELYLAFQPKINVETRQITGAEALVRWKHPEMGDLPPDEFIPPAEQTGLIRPLTLFVLEEALRQCSLSPQQIPGFTIAVNLSIRNLEDPLFPEEVDRLLTSFRMAPGRLTFEITETGIMTNPETAIRTINTLSQKGMFFSIDDFGIGHSSLSYLKNLKAKSIKIDKSFIIDLLGNSSNGLLVWSTINLAHNMGMKVIAEGVENKEVLEALAYFGCDEAQGHYLSRPVSAEALTQMFDKTPPTIL